MAWPQPRSGRRPGRWREPRGPGPPGLRLVSDEREALSRKRTALDWMAVAVEEHGREIVEVYLQAMRKGDWRAAEALMSRIYGKPEETVRQVEVNRATA